MKRPSTRRLSLFVLAFAALLGARAEAGAYARRASSRAQSARVGRELKIRAGRSVTFKGEDLRLRFLRVAEDSRCPKNVECVWAGNAAVLVEVGAKGGGRSRTLRLNTNASPERPAEAKHGAYTVRLVALGPYPRDARKIRQGEYTAALLVVRD